MLGINLKFWDEKGVRGIFPLCAIFTDFLLWKFCKNTARGHPQAVLAITPYVMTQVALAIPAMESNGV